MGAMIVAVWSAWYVGHRQPGAIDAARTVETAPSAADEAALRAWLHDVDTELTPGRRLAASAALARIELGLNNEWYDTQQQAGTLPSALAMLRRLRNGLADAAG